MKMLKSLIDLFTGSTPETVHTADPTVYRIETTRGEHSGRIVYQDDMIINLQSLELKQIKILKSNVQRVSIIMEGSRAVTAKHTCRWP